ncbi:Riboflavin synthase [Saitozyma sp. JCM 24511]|nr:Riboflavin synthase [Saitozyma sp. JCM 24511]
MFTGLIEHLSRISTITPVSAEEGFTFTLDQAGPILGDCSIGDSICINGACLTVTSFDAALGTFTVGLAPETLDRTNLGRAKVGDYVNCERAMAGHTRFGGHMVQGHVDTTATIDSVTPDGNSLRYIFKLSNPSLLPYLVEKGYVAIDGASLTLTVVDDKEAKFGIMLIAHSQEKLTLTKKKVGNVRCAEEAPLCVGMSSRYQPGDTVNIEVDCVGKYVLGSADRIESLVERIVERKLKEKGL